MKTKIWSQMAVGAALVACAWITSQEIGVYAEEPPKANAAADAKSELPVRFLLHRNDSVIVGQIQKSEKGYSIHRNGGTAHIAENLVQYVGDALDDLYWFKRNQIPNYDVAEHMKLYDWCVAEKMNEAAEAELKHVLELDPGHPRAKRAMARLEEKRNPTVVEKKKPLNSRPAPIRPDPAAYVSSFVSGHGQDTLLEYTQKHEPRIMNKCVQCHSANYDGKFRMIKRRYNDVVDQRLTAHNLQVILDAISFSKPEESPLLYYAISPHGPNKIPPFGGVNDPMFQELRDWVYKVAESHAIDQRVLAGKAAAPVTGPKKFAPQFTAGSEGTEFGSLRHDEDLFGKFGRPTGPGTNGSAFGLPGMTATADDAPPTPPNHKPLPPANGKKSDDPFDPAGFNGSSADKGKTASESQTRSPIPESIDLPAGKRLRGVFKAATPPLSLGGAAAINAPRLTEKKTKSEETK